MDFLWHALEWFAVGAPLLGCSSGWWFWTIARNNASTPHWRRIAGLLGLIFVTVSIAFGVLSLTYWNRFPGSASPKPTYIATYLGLYAGIVAIPISFCAMSRTRVALIFGFTGLATFYFLMFLSP